MHHRYFAAGTRVRSEGRAYHAVSAPPSTKFNPCWYRAIAGRCLASDTADVQFEIQASDEIIRRDFE